MAEDLDDHRRIFDGGDHLQGTAAVGAVLKVDIEDPFEQSAERRRAKAIYCRTTSARPLPLRSSRSTATCLARINSSVSQSFCR